MNIPILMFMFVLILVNVWCIYVVKDADTYSLRLIRNIVYQLIGVEVITIVFLTANKLLHWHMDKWPISQWINQFRPENFGMIASFIIEMSILGLSIGEIAIVDYWKYERKSRK